MSIVERALQKAGAMGRAAERSGAAAERSGATPEAEPNVQSRRIAPVTPKGSGSGEFAGHLDLRLPELRAAGLIVPADMEQRNAEELRLIKRPLLLNAEGGGAVPLTNGNLVMIGSALPGAGKTFMSLNLAMSMASELDWTVLLIDADVGRATLSRKLGLADAPGLMGLLEHERGDVAQYAFKTNLPGLHILPAGPTRPNVKELLGSQRMRTVVADLTARHERRIVIFDSPPLLLTSEARVLASYVGQIVLVVEAGVTPRRSLLDAIETLDTSKAINLVLNKNRQLLGMGDYQYAGYGAYEHDANDKTEG